MSTLAENELNAFLAGLPLYKRKELEQGPSAFSSYSQEEQSAWTEWMTNTPVEHDVLRQEYVRLLQRVPARLRDYVRRERRENDQIFAAYLPKIPANRPRKDSLADEALQLKNAGHSYKQIAIRLKVTREDGSPNGEQIRGLLKSRRLKARKADSPSGKNQN